VGKEGREGGKEGREGGKEGGRYVRPMVGTIAVESRIEQAELNHTCALDIPQPSCPPCYRAQKTITAAGLRGRTNMTVYAQSYGSI
jgi:hypothetical protein